MKITSKVIKGYSVQCENVENNLRTQMTGEFDSEKKLLSAIATINKSSVKDAGPVNMCNFYYNIEGNKTVSVSTNSTISTAEAAVIFDTVLSQLAEMIAADKVAGDIYQQAIIKEA